jgi:sugar phosphate isomerase/epimerase
MGTPKLDIYESINFMKRLGYDGIEVRVAENGQINSEKITDEEVAKIKEYACKKELEVACLTSYYKDFVSDARPVTISRLKRVVEIAAGLNCRIIRVYGGMDPCPQGIWFVDNWNRTVSGIREVAEFAAAYKVNIAIETHVGSLTMSARDTVRMIEDVNMNNVGMLFDYAWVELAGVEAGAAAVKAVARHIIHCHVKDWKLESRTPIKKQSCLMGEGTVNWKETLKALSASGYNGYICDEYEKFWYPDQLPEPETGMAENLNWVRERLK